MAVFVCLPHKTAAGGVGEFEPLLRWTGRRGEHHSRNVYRPTPHGSLVSVRAPWQSTMQHTFLGETHTHTQSAWQICTITTVDGAMVVREGVIQNKRKVVSYTQSGFRIPGGGVALDHQANDFGEKRKTS